VLADPACYQHTTRYVSIYGYLCIDCKQRRLATGKYTTTQSRLYYTEKVCAMKIIQVETVNKVVNFCVVSAFGASGDDSLRRVRGSNTALGSFVNFLLHIGMGYL
jgi:hypothetical protein